MKGKISQAYFVTAAGDQEAYTGKQPGSISQVIGLLILKKKKTNRIKPSSLIMNVNTEV